MTNSELREAFNRLEQSDMEAIFEYLAEHSKKNSKRFPVKINHETLKSSTVKINQETTTAGLKMRVRVVRG